MPDRRQVAVDVVDYRRQRGGGIADRRRVGGVGIDQDLGLLAAIDRAVEVGRHADDEQGLAGFKRVFGFGFRREQPDIIIAGVLQGRGDGPLVFRRLGEQQSGGQMFRVGIDRITEQEQLHDRQRDDQAERHTVAPHLDPFLAQQRIQPFQGEVGHWAVSLLAN